MYMYIYIYIYHYFWGGEVQALKGHGFTVHGRIPPTEGGGNIVSAPAEYSMI